MIFAAFKKQSIQLQVLLSNWKYYISTLFSLFVDKAVAIHLVMDLCAICTQHNQLLHACND